MAAVFFPVGTTCAAELAPDAYVRSFNLIKQGDQQVLVDPLLALQSYLQAEQALARLRQGSPQWNAVTVDDQIRLVQAKIKPLKDKFGIPQPEEMDPARPAPPVFNAVEFNRRLDQLRAEQRRRDGEHERQLAKFKKSEENLQIRLKEAIGARPRDLDPGELARVEEQNRSLRGEVVNLQAKFQQGKDFLYRLQSALNLTEKTNAALQKKINDQSGDKTLKKLVEENQRLRKRIVELNRSTRPAKDINALQRQILLLQRQLAAERARADALAEDKKKLEKLLSEAP